MTRHRITITPNTPRFGAHQLLVDGHDISNGVRSLRLALNPGEIPTVELGLGIIEIDRMESEQAELYIPDTTRDALITLGWTPPAPAVPEEMP
ncbi:hypothetical protein [Streptosporangium canum]|uniref:hypothetical protein n=1 Tax=Streptosporangium canum TaxID=324952 RepID=UPI003797E9D0